MSTIRPPRSTRRASLRLIACGGIGALSLAVVLSLSELGTAHAAEPPAPAPVATAPSTLFSTTATAESPVVAPTQIAAAAAAFEQGDAASSAQLADAVTTLAATPLAAAPDVLATATSDVGTVSIADSGAIALTSDGLPALGLSVTGETDSVQVVDGAVVQAGVAPATDVVTRATDQGIQMVAILADESAPGELAFQLDLPGDATLMPQADGSILLLGSIETEQAIPAELDRVNAQIAAIIGSDAALDDLDSLTDQQWAALDAIAPAATQTVTTFGPLATIDTPWAVDANGNPVDTHYVIDDNTIKQLIETDADTAFPVIADPSVVWWIWTSAGCIADLSTLIFAAAKLTNAVVKIGNIIKSSAKLSAAVSKLGGAAKVLDTIYKAAKGWVEGSVGKYLTSTQRLALSALASSSMNLIGDALGIGSCVSLIRAIF